jgi:hypothetical protein
MPTLTIALNDEEMRYLEQTAHQLGLRVEDLVRLGIDEYVARRQRFERAADYVLRKNAELYRRLAQ